MLIFTNRVMKSASNESAFTTSYTQGPSVLA